MSSHPLAKHAYIPARNYNHLKVTDLKAKRTFLPAIAAILDGVTIILSVSLLSILVLQWFEPQNSTTPGDYRIRERPQSGDGVSGNRAHCVKG